MRHQTVKSSMIHSVAHDPLTGKMHVRFKKDGKPGDTYEYDGVKPHEHHALMAADSAGQHFNKHIAPHHKGRKIGVSQQMDESSPQGLTNTPGG